MTQTLPVLILVTSLLLQAYIPSGRVLIVTVAAGLTCLVSTVFGTVSTQEILMEVPWDVLVILVGLGLLSEMFVASRLFGVLAMTFSRWSRGEPRRVIVLFSVAMYCVSGLVNNLTALILVLPVLLILLRLLGTQQRYLSWLLGVVLVSCNLGGAATPIGDFPAILMLGRGSMTFQDYLVNALPPTFCALAGILLFTLGVIHPERGLDRNPLSARLSLEVMAGLYRNFRLDKKLFAPPALILGLMLLAWTFVPASSGITPELICWLGVGAALLTRGVLGEQLLRRRVDVEAVLFLLALFVMVVAVRKSGFFTDIGQALVQTDWAPTTRLLVFLVTAGVLTGLFSAGPSMAAMLEVAEVLAQSLPPTAVYVGLALSVCAGSSLFLTAATSGPMAQALTERAGLQDGEGRPLSLGFMDFLPVGLTAFGIIQGVAILYSLLALT